MRLLALVAALRPHGLNLSVGTAAPADRAYLSGIADLVRRLRSAWWSDHLAMTHADGIDISHLAPLSRTHAALDVVCDNVRRAQAAVEAPFVLEHIASPLVLPGAEMSEAAFVTGRVFVHERATPRVTTGRSSISPGA